VRRRRVPLGRPSHRSLRARLRTNTGDDALMTLAVSAAVRVAGGRAKLPLAARRDPEAPELPPDHGGDAAAAMGRRRGDG
jgi:hypothetical protein